MYINRTIKCLKRLQKRSIDDNLRQLVLIRQDRVLVNLSTCFFTSDSGVFFFYFSKQMGRSGDGKRNILWGWPNDQWKLSRRVGLDLPKRCLRFAWRNPENMF